MILEPVPVDALSPAARKFAGPGVPEPARAMAARGLAPLPPKDLCSVLAFLSHEQPEGLAIAAKKTLGGLPERILEGVLREPLHPAVLHAMARILGNTPRWAELILLNAGTEDDTVQLIAPWCEERQLEIIAQNETRLLRAPRIIEALYLNPRTRMSTVDRVIEFAVRGGLELTGIPVFKEVQAAILGLRHAAPAEEEDEPLPPELADDASAPWAAPAVAPAPWSAPQAAPAAAPQAPPTAAPRAAAPTVPAQPAPAQPAPAQPAPAAAAPAAAPAPLRLTPIDAVDALSPDEVAALHDEREGTEEAAGDSTDAAPAAGAAHGGNSQAGRGNIQAVLIKMTASQRVRWAVLGNREVRAYLMRDSNKMVAAAAIKNPRVSEQEVITIANSRSVNDEVIRVIGNSREWTKTYQVRLNLVNNPKCPLPKALFFLRGLRANDIRAIAKSKNVPSAVATAARRLSATIK